MCLQKLMLTKPVVYAMYYLWNWYFLKVNFRFQPKVWYGYHGLMQKVISTNDFRIASVKENESRIYFLCIYKEEAINLLKNIDLSKENRSS